MVLPRGPKTRIRITEGDTDEPLGLVLLVAGIGGLLSIGAYSIASATGATGLLPLAAAAGAFGATYATARAWFRGLMERRLDILSTLMERLHAHVIDMASRGRLGHGS